MVRPNVAWLTAAVNQTCPKATGSDVWADIAILDASLANKQSREIYSLQLQTFPFYHFFFGLKRSRDRLIYSAIVHEYCA